MMSMVLRPGRKPLWASGKLFSDEPIEEDAGQDFSSNGKQGNAPVISAVWFRTFILVGRNYGGVTEVCWHSLFLSNGHKDVVECLGSCGTNCLVQFCRNVGVSVELHFFSFLLPPSVLYAAKLSLGSDLTVSVSVAPRGTVWVVLPISVGLSLLIQQGPNSLVVVIKLVLLKLSHWA